MKLIVNNWLNKIHINQKEQQIINIEKLIQSIKEKGLLISLLKLERLKNEIKDDVKKENLNIGAKTIKEMIKDNKEMEEKLNVLLEVKIKNISEVWQKQNPIIFKLELYKPKLHLLELIVWLFI